MKNFLNELLEIDSPSGFTMKAQNFVITEFQKLGFSATQNKKGNVNCLLIKL